MTTDVSLTTDPMIDAGHYRVEQSPQPKGYCDCAECQWWGIISDEPEPVEIGQTWRGPAGKEAAEDICELMNMAFDAGRETQHGITEFKAVLNLAAELCDAVDKEGEDIGGHRGSLTILRELGPAVDAASEKLS